MLHIDQHSSIKSSRPLLIFSFALPLLANSSSRILLAAIIPCLIEPSSMPISPLNLLG